MIPDHMLPHTVQRIRPATSTNAYGDEELTYTVPPASSKDMRAWVQQERPQEIIEDGRHADVREWTLIVNDSDVMSKDRIVFGGLVFEVDGPPEDLYTPAGYHHTEAALKLVEG